VICSRCRTEHSVQRDPDDEDGFIRSVCVCEVTGRCAQCKQGPIVQAILAMDKSVLEFVCRAHAREGTVKDLPAPVQKTGPDSLDDIFAAAKEDIARDIHNTYRCDNCQKTYKGHQQKVTRTKDKGFTITCPKCGSPGGHTVIG